MPKTTQDIARMQIEDYETNVRLDKIQERAMIEAQQKEEKLYKQSTKVPVVNTKESKENLEDYRINIKLDQIGTFARLTDTQKQYEQSVPNTEEGYLKRKEMEILKLAGLKSLKNTDDFQAQKKILESIGINTMRRGNENDLHYNIRLRKEILELRKMDLARVGAEYIDKEFHLVLKEINIPLHEIGEVDGLMKLQRDNKSLKQYIITNAIKFKKTFSDDFGSNPTRLTPTDVFQFINKFKKTNEKDANYVPTATQLYNSLGDDGASDISFDTDWFANSGLGAVNSGRGPHNESYNIVGPGSEDDGYEDDFEVADDDSSDNSSELTFNSALSPPSNTSKHHEMTQTQYQKDQALRGKLNALNANYTASVSRYQEKGYTVSNRVVVRTSTGQNNQSTARSSLHLAKLVTNIALIKSAIQTNSGGASSSSSDGTSQSGTGIKRKIGNKTVHYRTLLDKNRLDVRHNSGSNINGFPIIVVSDKFVSFVNRLLEGKNKPSDSEVRELQLSEEQLYKRLLNVTNNKIHNADGIDDMKKRLRLIEGEIQAGNDSKSLLAEAKEILNSFASYGRITRKESGRFYRQLQNQLDEKK